MASMDFSFNHEYLNKLYLFSSEHNFLFMEDENTLLKIISEDLLEMILYLSTLPKHEHVIFPKKVGKIHFPDIKDVYAYRMDYLEHSYTLWAFNTFNKNISYEEKMVYCKQLFDALMFLHQYIVLGDIHAKNILIQDKNAYLIDFDYCKKKTAFLKSISCYYYVNGFKHLGNSIRTDIIKLYIACFSFLLDIDLETYIHNYGYNDFIENLLAKSLPKEIYNFFKISNHRTLFQKSKEEIYDFERFMTPEVMGLKKTLDCFNTQR